MDVMVVRVIKLLNRYDNNFVIAVMKHIGPGDVLLRGIHIKMGVAIIRVLKRRLNNGVYSDIYYSRNRFTCGYYFCLYGSLYAREDSMIKVLLQFLKDLITFHDKTDIPFTLSPPNASNTGASYNANVKFKKIKLPHKTIAKHYLTIDIDRIWFSKKSTIGKLYINGEFECYTLEDMVRNEKKYGETAIPSGGYEVKITYSPKFKTKLPVLIDVPNFRGIRIHPGNTHKDTEGCILVGQTRTTDFIGRSRRAFNGLFKKLKAAEKAGKKIIFNVEV